MQDQNKKMLIFGGSFDPPHIGHINLLKSAVEIVKPDEVMVIPSGMSPHKKNSETDWHIRSEMCESFYDVFSNMNISDIENKRSGKSYTYDTICALKEIYPENEWYLCIGEDMLESFVTWHRWQEVLSMATLVVMRRTEGDKDLTDVLETLEKAGGKVKLAQGAAVPASSSSIRNMVANGEDISSLVVPKVKAVIRKHCLYL